ncbi:hypothetical protein GCM10027290_38750 [Micromonospora sonneratiae]|uniref:DUF4878 domain-containing protein n=1 Tax=Micromonospora sonneratiae TaxID=1184706 RepID=A0ABW3YB37_9ACTN
MARLRQIVLAATLVVLPLGMTACGSDDGDEGGRAAEDAAQKARERVQGYLDAMVAKNVDAGRTQLCPSLHETFDKAATGPNGDFAKHFTVSAASITDVRADNGTQKVSTAVTVVGERTSQVGLLFTVVKSDGQWCIAREEAGGNVTPSPADPSPAGGNAPVPADPGGGPSPRPS